MWIRIYSSMRSLQALNATEIRTPRITVTKALVQVEDDEAFSALQMSGAKTVIDLAGTLSVAELGRYNDAPLGEHNAPDATDTENTP